MDAGGWLDVIRLWFRSRFLRARVDRDLHDEFRFHLDRQTAAFIREGMSPEAARQAALERFGDIDDITTHSRDAADEGLRLSLDEWRQVTMAPRFANLLVLVAVLAALGAGVGYVKSRLQPRQYHSEATLKVIPSDASTAEGVAARLRTTQWKVLSRTRLERIIVQFNLYPSDTKIMEDRVEEMRLHIDIRAGSDRTFTVGYTGGDPTTATKVTELLAAYFRDENARAQERSREAGNNAPVGEQYTLVTEAGISARPVPPSAQPTWIGAFGGLALGLLIAVIVVGTRMWRRRPPAAPMPELAGH